MSLVKWCPTQHALPRSAILTEIVSIGLAGVPAPSLSDVVLLLRDIPDMSWVSISLCMMLETEMAGIQRVMAVRGFFTLLLSSIILVF